MTDNGTWAQRSACLGADPDKFFSQPGKTYSEGRAICATCPVVVECLNASFEARERDGLWGGAGDPQRRLLRVAWLQKVPGHDYEPGHHCAWCQAVDGHLARLRAEHPSPLNFNGPGARHGKRSSYARGCRNCGPCTLAYSPLGRHMRDTGIDVLDWWHRHIGYDYAAGKQPDTYDQARRLAHQHLADWWLTWFGIEVPDDPDDPRWPKSRAMAEVDLADAA